MSRCAATVSPFFVFERIQQTLRKPTEYNQTLLKKKRKFARARCIVCMRAACYAG